MSEKKLVDTTALARQMGRHPETIRRMCRANQIPFVKVNPRSLHQELCRKELCREFRECVGVQASPYIDTERVRV